MTELRQRFTIIGKKILDYFKEKNYNYLTFEHTA